jgi:hypothetical protein
MYSSGALNGCVARRGSARLEDSVSRVLQHRRDAVNDRLRAAARGADPVTVDLGSMPPRLDLCQWLIDREGTFPSPLSR